LLYRLVKASRVAESWAVLAKSLGETTFFCTMEKKISIWFSQDALDRGVDHDGVRAGGA